MSMLPFEKDTDLVYNRNYKVCYYIDDKRIETGIFTNKLINIDNTYFWFSSVEYGLAVIRQDMVVYMGYILLLQTKLNMKSIIRLNILWQSEKENPIV